MFSKKIILAIIFFLILVGGTLGIKMWQTYGSSLFNKGNHELVSTTPPSPKLYIDTDKDGLKDWEETLWKTDPNNPDTDQDGTSDFEEIRNGRDPLKPGPDDVLTKEEINKKTNEIIESDLTETDKFSRMFLAQYIASKNRGDYKKGDYDKLISLINKPIDEKELFKKTASDFSVVKNSSTNIKTYANSISKIIKEAQKKYPANELAELDKVTQNPKDFNVDIIKTASERYFYLAGEFLKVKVPADLLNLHLKMTNVLYVISDSVSAMEFYVTDPVKVISKISVYPDSLEILNNSLVDLGNYFKEHNIKFSTTDDGYIYFGRL